ncbi:MAG: hypothetical protein L3J37_06410 [Rhodobacteraceae bacterium]|nr:hypothetical protein [Paracoccaceae bacterium]
MRTYERQLSDENAEIAEWLVKLTIARQGIENTREGATVARGVLACAFCIYAT